VARRKALPSNHFRSGSATPGLETLKAWPIAPRAATVKEASEGDDNLPRTRYCLAPPPQLGFEGFDGHAQALTSVVLSPAAEHAVGVALGRV